MEVVGTFFPEWEEKKLCEIWDINHNISSDFVIENIETLENSFMKFS